VIEAARESLLSRVPGGEPLRSGQIPFTPSGKQALEGSLKEAMATQAPAIGPEQLLLGVLNTDDDHVTSILADQHVAVDELRRSVLERGAQSLRERSVLKLEVFDALLLALEHRDEVMTIASHATSREDAVAALRERFAVSQQAARAILDLRVSSFTKEERQRLATARTDLRTAVEEGGSGASS
jgi:ATP-dependent Clp protease ATP-binding subunit ClpA